MVDDVVCAQCGEKMKLSVQPVERRRHLPITERPSTLSTTVNEFLCPNNHYRELSYHENRMLE